MKLAALVSAILSLAAAAAAPPELEAKSSFGAAFEQERAAGTFVLLDPATGKARVWNPERAAKRFIPASTFKIANSLIGLETGAVKGVDEVLPYGGKPQFIKEWEKDAGLREAMRISSVPVYQELARRIGPERMARGVAALDYGNARTGAVVDRFWLDGPLEISALEQARFLQRLLAGELPLKPATMESVKGIVPTETEGDLVIHFKTGWCTATKPQLGWMVGWVETKGKSYPFALNIDMAGIEDAPKRMKILKACLESAGLP